MGALASPRRVGGPPLKINLARRLRREQTEAERKVWSMLRRHQMEGVQFRRQQPNGSFIADFYCAAAKLVIELDGGQHGEDAIAARDAERTRWLESEGYRVLRFWNSDVNEHFDGVLETIRLAVVDRLAPLPGPPPQGGRENSNTGGGA